MAENNLPAGDMQDTLARCVTHEPSSQWPDLIEIVAMWKPRQGGIRGKRKSVRISAEQYFGATGAPMSGEQLLSIIERLRKS